jgi:hypothetical protein
VTAPQITSVPLVSIPGRSIAILPDIDPAYTGQAFYTVDLEPGDLWGASWWETPDDVRRHADQCAADGQADADLWATVADIIEKAVTP